MKYFNHQDYSDCQVVTAVNAFMYLTGDRIIQKSSQYEAFVDLSAARIGAALFVERVHRILGITSAYESMTTNFYKFPSEIKVWTPKYGFHSACVINRDDTFIHVMNMSKHTNNEWIREKNLREFLFCPSCDNWVTRQFKIIKY